MTNEKRKQLARMSLEYHKIKLNIAFCMWQAVENHDKKQETDMWDSLLAWAQFCEALQEWWDKHENEYTGMHAVAEAWR